MIDDYKKCITSVYFKYAVDLKDQNGNPNQRYFGNHINRFRDHCDAGLKANESLAERFDLLAYYNGLMSLLMEKTMLLFITCDKYDGTDETVINDFNIFKNEIDDYLDAVKEYGQVIEHNVIEGNPDIAIKIRRYCIVLFNQVKRELKNTFFIDIDKSPLKDDFETVFNELGKSIDFDELNLLNELINVKTKQSPQSKNSKSDEVKKTLFEYFFNIDDKVKFINELKKLFLTEKGKSIKAMLNILTEEKVLIIGAGEFKAFYSELKNNFNRNIGSYTSINAVKFINPEVSDPIKEKLKPLINKYKTT